MPALDARFRIMYQIINQPFFTLNNSGPWHKNFFSHVRNAWQYRGNFFILPLTEALDIA